MEDRGIYAIKRIVRVTQQISGMSESPKRLKAQHELGRDLVRISWILNWFVLPYIRNQKEQRVKYQINKLINEFKRAEKEELPQNPEALRKRQERLRKKILFFQLNMT